jgi:hypothetical protein
MSTLIRHATLSGEFQSYVVFGCSSSESCCSRSHHSLPSSSSLTGTDLSTCIVAAIVAGIQEK